MGQGREPDYRISLGVPNQLLQEKSEERKCWENRRLNEFWFSMLNRILKPPDLFCFPVLPSTLSPENGRTKSQL